MLKGNVFNIQRFSIHDGPGIRTNVFLKGCPLNCVWCHNPESKAPESVLSYVDNLCVGCGRCVKVCKQGCHGFVEGKHVLDRSNCILCGKCADVCFGALEIIGREMTCDEVITEVLRDRLFYANSGGGVTLSGGEPLYQHEFALGLLKLARAEGLHNCVETSGYTDFSILKGIIDYTDLFLFDWKVTNNKLHKKYTGASNRVIYENLLSLDRAGAETILRCPIIQGYNDMLDHFEGMAEIANRLGNIRMVDISPYNPLGKSKCERIGCNYDVPDMGIPSEEQVQEWIRQVQDRTDVPVRRI